MPEQLTGIEVVGKIAGGSGQKDLHESDLVVHTQNPQGQTEDFFIGLKLCKTNSFVNTKSGGAQTFLTRYFAAFSEAVKYQQELNSDMERAYHMMGQNLYEETGLVAGGYEFKGYFGPEWLESDSRVTWTINTRAREWFCNIINAIQSLYTRMSALSQTAPRFFSDSLYPIVGFGARNLIQAIVFVDSKQAFDGKKQYGLNSFKIHTEEDVVMELSEMQMAPLQQAISSFEIMLKSWRLQIRMKPMNKFTVPGLKVNCSVKYDRSSGQIPHVY